VKKSGVVVVFGILLVLTVVGAERSHKINLSTSKALTLPVPGYLGRTNSFPATIALSPDGRYAALLNQGYGTQETGARQSIAILDLSNNQLHDFRDDRLSDAESTHQSYYIGLAFSSDGADLYASIGSITDPEGKGKTSTGNGIAVYKFAEGQVTPERFIKIPPQKLAAGKVVSYGIRTTPEGTAPPYPAGFAVLKGEKGDRLLIANNLSDNVVLLDVKSGQILTSFDLSRSKYVPSAYPYTVVANKAGTKAWVSLWNTSMVVALDLVTGTIAQSYKVNVTLGDTSLTPKAESDDSTAPSAHATAMALSPTEDIVYLALSNSDCVVGLGYGESSERDKLVVINPEPPTDLVRGVRLYNVNFEPRSPKGSVPQSIALSPDGQWLFVAGGTLDAVAVFPVGAPGHRPVGFIPTEWYPSALAIAGNDLLIATAKGQGSGANNMMGTLKSERRHKDHPYIPTLIGGSIQRISLSDIDKNLAAWTRQVEEDNLLHSDPGKLEFAGGKNPIKHVIYILKENRTYDQVLGDLPVGNGDPSLTLYGAEVTPNLHRIALQFGVLDNFYDSGEVSGDGHIWSTASITTDYNEKNWPIGYRSKERTYDADGSVADELPLEQGIPDIDDPATGFIWDNLAKHGLSYRIYGEFIQAIWCQDQKSMSPKQGTPSPTSAACSKPDIRQGDAFPANVGNPKGGPSPWPWPVPIMKKMRATKAALRDHFDPLFPDFNTDYPDQLRADEFLREFDDFVKSRGTAKELPQFILLYLPDDHTGGTKPGGPTPKASVADNDLAVGRTVEAVSHSPYWEDTAIFVIEDDAQDGADHVDAHRSTAYVISKYSPRGEKPFVESHFYTTVSMVHTMEELLGLPPMNLFDAHAPLMTSLFSGPGTQPPFQSDDANLRSGLIYTVNTKRAPGAKESAEMDFSRPDAANAALLNSILWRNEKGDVPIPTAPHGRTGSN